MFKMIVNEYICVTLWFVRIGGTFERDLWTKVLSRYFIFSKVLNKYPHLVCEDRVRFKDKTFRGSKASSIYTILFYLLF